MALPELKTIDLATPVQNYFAIKRQKQQDQLATEQNAFNRDLLKTKVESEGLDRRASARKEVEGFTNNLLMTLSPDDPQFNEKKFEIADAVGNYAHQLGIPPEEITRGAEMFITTYTPQMARGRWTKEGFIKEPKQMVSKGRLVTISDGQVSSEAIPGMPQGGGDGGGGDVPMNIREWQQYSAMTPEDQERYLTMKRANQYRDIGGQIVQPSQVFPGQISGEIPKTLPPQDLPENIAAAETAKKTAEVDVKKKATFPKVRETLNSLNRQWDVVDSKIDEAISKVGPYTAGMGVVLSDIPATPQRNLKGTLETIKVNIGFDKLQDMRDNSPTGGALGQVSDTENRLLQAVQGSLDQGQSAQQLKQNLQQIKILLAEIRSQKKLAFDTDYGEIDKPKSGVPVQEQPQPLIPVINPETGEEELWDIVKGVRIK